MNYIIYILLWCFNFLTTFLVKKKTYLYVHKTYIINRIYGSSKFKVHSDFLFYPIIFLSTKKKYKKCQKCIFKTSTLILLYFVYGFWLFINPIFKFNIERYQFHLNKCEALERVKSPTLDFCILIFFLVIKS